MHTNERNFINVKDMHLSQNFFEHVKWDSIDWRESCLHICFLFFGSMRCFYFNSLSAWTIQLHIQARWSRNVMNQGNIIDCSFYHPIFTDLYSVILQARRFLSTKVVAIGSLRPFFISKNNHNSIIYSKKKRISDLTPWHLPFPWIGTDMSSWNVDGVERKLNSNHNEMQWKQSIFIYAKCKIIIIAESKSCCGCNLNFLPSIYFCNASDNALFLCFSHAESHPFVACVCDRKLKGSKMHLILVPMTQKIGKGFCLCIKNVVPTICKLYY